MFCWFLGLSGQSLLMGFTRATYLALFTRNQRGQERRYLSPRNTLRDSELARHLPRSRHLLHIQEIIYYINSWELLHLPSLILLKHCPMSSSKDIVLRTWRGSRKINNLDQHRYPKATHQKKNHISYYTPVTLDCQIGRNQRLRCCSLRLDASRASA